jgi:hypothetical protein
LAEGAVGFSAGTALGVVGTIAIARMKNKPNVDSQDDHLDDDEDWISWSDFRVMSEPPST